MKTSLSLPEWNELFQSLSNNYATYGKFLSEQDSLIKRIYNSVFKIDKIVSILVAPPASGKTHIICTLAQILINQSNSVIIVTPSNYLKQEFENERSHVKGGLEGVKIKNLFEYLNDDEIFDYVLIDESHNLKSFIELDDNIVKTVFVSNEIPAYDEIIKHLPHGKQFIAKQVSFSSAKDILDSLKEQFEFRGYLKEIIKDPTSWKTFVFAGRNHSTNVVQFMKSQPAVNLKLPKKRMLLFSATGLFNEELSFYCGIKESQIYREQPVYSSSTWRKEQRFYVGLKDEPKENVKIEFLKSLLQKTNVRTLVLFSNSHNCNKFYESCKENNRIISIPNEFDYNKGAFDKFTNTDNSILFSSSSILWEGITIRELKLLIIVDIPFPRPSLLDLIHDDIPDSNKVTIRRLEQGIGRIARRKGERGICIFLFNPNLKLEKWITALKKRENYADEFSWDVVSKCISFLNP